MIISRDNYMILSPHNYMILSSDRFMILSPDNSMILSPDTSMIFSPDNYMIPLHLKTPLWTTHSFYTILIPMASHANISILFVGGPQGVPES